MKPETKEWAKLVALVIGSGCAVGVTSFLGGAKLGVAIVCGLGTGMTNVYHALNDSPKDKAATPDAK